MTTASKQRDVNGILHFLTPQQMAEEIVRLDALLAGDAALSQENVQRQLFDIRSAMIRYGTAYKKDDTEGIRSTSTEASDLLGQLATHAYAEGRKDEREELQIALGQAREALEMARTGLDWYRGMMPEYVDDSDNEADEEITGAITALEAALATGVSASRPIQSHGRGESTGQSLTSEAARRARQLPKAK